MQLFWTEQARTRQGSLERIQDVPIEWADGQKGHLAVGQRARRRLLFLKNIPKTLPIVMVA